MYGCGIAFPELVKNKAGEESFNIGIWKFVKFLRQVVPIWI